MRKIYGEGRGNNAKKAIHGVYKEAPLQQKALQVLYSVYSNYDTYAMPEHKADMGADMGRDIYRIIQIVYCR